MSTEILLAVPKSVADLGPFSNSLTLGQGWPTDHIVTVGDKQEKIPVTYLDKDVIEEGEYVHPKTGQKVHATRQQLKDWKRKFDEMHLAGALEPSIPCDHRVGAKDNLGFVKAARLIEVPDAKGKNKLRLRLTHAFIGKDAPLIALRNRASLGIDPDYTDGKGKNWGSVIIHSAITPDPVVTGMGSFAPTTMLSRGQQTVDVTTFLLSAQETSNMTKLSAAHRQKLCAKMGMSVPDPARLSENFDDDLMTKHMGMMDDDTTEMSAQHNDILSMSNDFKELAEILQIQRPAGMTLVEGIPKIKQAVKLNRELATDAINLARASDEPTMPDDNTLMLLANSFDTEFEATISAGGMSEACSKEVKALLMPEGRPNAIALSRADGDVKPLISKLLTALKNNKPVQANGNGQTGIQGRTTQLSRDVPNAASTPESRAAQKARMLEKANGVPAKK